MLPIQWAAPMGTLVRAQRRNRRHHKQRSFPAGESGGGFGYSGYVSLPGGILTNTSSITVECWVTQNQGNGWAEVWDFGNNGNQNFALIPYPAEQ